MSKNKLQKFVMGYGLWVMGILVITFSLITSNSSFITVYAQDTLKAPAGSVDANIKAESIPQFIVNTLFIVAAFLAVLYLMYGGVKWITSRGDKMAVESARKHIVAAVIGLVIVAGSFFALNVVFNLLGAENPLKNGFKLPTLKSVNQ